jgi:sulfatase modifying factor 1
LYSDCSDFNCSFKDKIKQLEIVETNKNPNLKSCCDKINKIDFINKHGPLNLKVNDSLNLKTSQVTVTNKMLLIRGGEFMMGANNDQWALRREFPKHKVKVNSFLMDMHEVTNREFMEFVNATGYRTVAEQKIDWKIIKNQLPTGSPKPHDSLLAAGSLVFFQPKNILNTIDFSQW